MSDEIAARRQKCREMLAEQNLDAAYFCLPANVRYLSGYTGSDAALLTIGKKCWLLTDSRYQEEATKSAPGCKLVLWEKSMADSAAALLQKNGCKRLGIEAGELTVRPYETFRRAKITPVPLAPAFAALRQEKSRTELAAIKRSVKIAEAAFRELKKRLRGGMRELEIKAELEYLALQNGADGMSFPTIVAVGANSSLPHAQAGKRVWKPGMPLLIDFGVMAGGYASDLTRTLYLGSISPFWKERHQAVLDAQQAGIAAIKAGVPGKEADEAARAVFRRNGWEKYFIHSLGHGIGLQIHEAPRLSRLAAAPLPQNSVVTAEPGLYFPGKGGIRIEDDVLVTAHGGVVLSTLEKDWRDCII